jgi:hypothetical protein
MMHEDDHLLLSYKGSHYCHEPRCAHQPIHDVHGSFGVSPNGSYTNRRHRVRISIVDATTRGSVCRGLSGFAAGIRHFELCGRNDSRASDYARICRFLHPTVAKTRAHDVADSHHRCTWHGSNAEAISQVVLSLVLPMRIIDLIYFTRRRDIMGVLVNKRVVTLTATICAAVILSLNVLLLYLSFGGTLPF